MMPVVTMVEHADLASVEDWLVERHAELSAATWASPTEPERERVVDGVRRLLPALERCEPAALAQVAAALGPGWSLALHITPTERLVVAWEARPHGGPLSAWRCGEAAPLVVQAPHSHYDLGTDDLARSALLRAGVRGAMWNTVHRYRALPGERPEDPIHPADVCRQASSLFHTWSLAVAVTAPVSFLQLHGFAEGGVGAEAVLSSGDPLAPPVAISDALSPLLGTTAVFGAGINQLGGTENVLGRALRGTDRFLHLELSPGSRRRLSEQPSVIVDLVLTLMAAPWSF